MRCKPNNRTKKEKNKIKIKIKRKIARIKNLRLMFQIVMGNFRLMMKKTLKSEKKKSL